MKHAIATLIAALLMVFTACKHDKLEFDQELKNYRAAADFLKNNYDLSIFCAAVERAGMTAELNGPGPFTILAPTNRAFNEMGIMSVNDVAKMPVEKVKLMVQMHILPRRLQETDLADNSVDVRFKTLAGKEILVTMATRNGVADRNDLYFQGCYTELKNVTLTNGTLHVLQQVIKYTPGTVQDILSQHEEYSLFVGALKRFGLWDQLKEPGPWTILAPTNDALKAKKLDEQDIAIINPEKYYIARLFGCYILYNQHYFFSDFRAFYMMNSSNYVLLKLYNDPYQREIYIGEGMENGVRKVSYVVSLRLDRNTVPVSAVTVQRRGVMDFSADNGVVHQLDSLLAKPEDAVRK
ncbi:fasciclin domain-containing protein [Chitinophaga qingshengii]|uniref:Fasciclin domain-containing protein n=1 Tax=Chitinophaga qingshengii TaxID=1569794 RepID=A0ABR7TKC2_9BACT|nr:fasciclin domain-containing protein [Chitinophaga qingshengii]MBC9930904.1 fasciclin domain-containing protein [Chitinophaga qingshengii]